MNGSWYGLENTCFESTYLDLTDTVNKETSGLVDQKYLFSVPL